jgi:hypothetical protein
MKLKQLLAAVPLTVFALVGVGVTPALAATAAVASTQENAHVVIHQDKLDRGVQLAEAVNKIDTKYRDEFVRKAIDAAFNAIGKNHNVMLFNLSQAYEARIPTTLVYATVEFQHIFYGLWVFDDGEFTNKGDGGYLNWGFVGVFDRNGGHVVFHRF